MKRVSFLLFLGVPCLLFLGCGGSGDFGSPKATFETMVKAAKAEDKEAMMGCFCEESRANFKKLEEFGEKMGGPQGKQEMTDKFKGEPNYGEETIEGNKATLEVTMEEQTQPVQFVKEGGDWKISMPELGAAVQMMESMGDQMQEMMKGMQEGVGESMEEMGKSMQEAMKEAEKDK